MIEGDAEFVLERLVEGDGSTESLSDLFGDVHARGMLHPLTTFSLSLRK
jgi:hypothetical protein